MRRVKWIIAKCVEICVGTVFLLSPTQLLWRKMLPNERQVVGTKKIAVVAHVFYTELVGEVLQCWATVNAATGGGARLHITTTFERADKLRHILADHELVQLHVMPNRGRDIAPFIELLNSGTLDGYDAILKLHTKRSPHLTTGNLRRRLLFAVLAGNSANVQRILGMFDNPKTGMVGWRLSYRSSGIWWMGNKDRILELAKNTRPPLKVYVGFFEGSMFWARPRALTPLRALLLSSQNFEVEAHQLDGALHHAIERMFTLATWTQGYSVRSIRGAILVPGGETSFLQTASAKENATFN